MDNDAARHDFADVLALVQEQMRDLSDMQHRRALLSATAKAADGTVEVSVDAHGMVTEVLIDDSYVDQFELADLGGHITGAAREAAQKVHRQAAALLEPLTQRRDSIRALSDVAVDVPQLGEVLSRLNLPPSVPAGSPPAVNGDHESPGNSSYPRVRG